MSLQLFFMLPSGARNNFVHIEFFAQTSIKLFNAYFKFGTQFRKTFDVFQHIPPDSFLRSFGKCRDLLHCQLNCLCL